MVGWCSMGTFNDPCSPSARNEHQMSGQRFFMENFDPNTGEGHGAAPFTGRVSICSPNLTKSDPTDGMKLTWITRDEAWPAMADMAGWTTLVALIMADMPLELDFVLASESRTDLWEKRLSGSRESPSETCWQLHRCGLGELEKAWKNTVI